MSFKIETITAFIAIDKESGDEGVIGLPVPGSHTLSLPAIAADWDRAKDLYPHVKRYCHQFGVEFKVIRMHGRTDVTEDFKKVIE